MKTRFLASMLPVMLLAACASSPTVYTDADPGVNFNSFRSYTWLATAQDAPPLVQQRIVSDVDAQLQAKGWKRLPSGQAADVGIAAHVTTQQKQTLDTFYDGPNWGGWGWRYGYGYGGWGGGMGMSTTTVDTYEVGTLILDMFNNQTKKAIWRGTATGTIPNSPQQLDQGIKEGIDKMFADFPPGSKKK